ncbi:MAG: bifunctional proline dehydrogenase/L-glutamate gamma-semialdehyde dehydrogenase [Gammaproteobacteria bacterium]|nr:bifunctional proline dehydrogenase/L-glutamate gamma-semialdehyde dehydrogenase [Gammaproteobacteria bacterium]
MNQIFSYSATSADIEQWTLETGHYLLAALRSHANEAYPTDRWLTQFLQRIMENELFRVRALRFIDVLPALTDDVDLVGHLRAYFPDDDFPFGGAIRFGLEHVHGRFGDRLIAAALRAAVRRVARRFLGGNDIIEALSTALRLRARGIDVSLDLLGEATVSEAEALNYQRQYMEILQLLDGKLQPAYTTTTSSHLHVNLSIKASSLYSQMNPADLKGSVTHLAERLRPIFLCARDSGVSICLDMEQYEYKPIILNCFITLLSESEFRDWPDGCIALQAYLRETETDLLDLIAWSKTRSAPVTVRLVRGAYWDYETIIARQQGWQVPVWDGKNTTDANYEHCLQLLFASQPYVHIAVATHNVRSIALAHALAEKYGFAASQFEYQMLYGMAPALEDAVLGLGHPLRMYLPFGELISGMAYLTRRLLENSSSQSFQNMSMLSQRPEHELLAVPDAMQIRIVQKPQPKSAPKTVSVNFLNEPLHRFSTPEEREQFQQAIERVRRKLNRVYPLIIDGKECMTDNFIESVNPAYKEEIVGRVASAGKAEAENAIAGAHRSLQQWSSRSMKERAQYLLRTAELLHQLRDEFAAWEIIEAGKTWREADANVTEAIDFLNYYAQSAQILGVERGRRVAGEDNVWQHRPRGVGAIIPPWNFPLAILTGMLSAAIVTGNTVILKPSSQTPIIAAHLVALLHEAGIPKGVVQFLPGAGNTVGDFLVHHPRIHFIAFTGSLEVGRGIVQAAATLNDTQNHFKHVIVEMGGKNAIIIDSDADLDDAVPGVVHSAFGYQGQKCSAASRVIVVGSHNAHFLNRLVEATQCLCIGNPVDPGVQFGPVISAAAQTRILEAIERGKHEARVVLEIDCRKMMQGYFVGPNIFSDVQRDSFLAQEEIFGPVLSVIAARNFNEALEIANNTRYALTGGIYSRNPENIELAKRVFQAGNLYINRRITGAVVGRQPFGGFRMSGLGSKAGGPDYLLQFVIPQTITENTLRRGYAPGADTH